MFILLENARTFMVRHTVYNVHNLIHLCEDVRYFQCSLNDIAAFQFENHLQTLKKCVRKAQNPIAQITKRIAEVESAGLKPGGGKRSVARISTKRKDSCFLLYTEDVAFIQEKRPEEKYVCDVFKLCNVGSFFDQPCDSKLINVMFIKNLRDGARRKLLERRDFMRKIVCLPHTGGYVIFPMLHGVEKL